VKHREAYNAFLEGYRKGEGTMSEKLSILLEAVVALPNIRGILSQRKAMVFISKLAFTRLVALDAFCWLCFLVQLESHTLILQH
jgi:hypothetical protein